MTQIAELTVYCCSCFLKYGCLDGQSSKRIKPSFTATARMDGL